MLEIHRIWPSIRFEKRIRGGGCEIHFCAARHPHTCAPPKSHFRSCAEQDSACRRWAGSLQRSEFHPGHAAALTPGISLPLLR